jgi:hypothetical protein
MWHVSYSLAARDKPTTHEDCGFHVEWGRSIKGTTRTSPLKKEIMRLNLHVFQWEPERPAWILSPNKEQRFCLSILDYQPTLSWMKLVEAREVTSSHVMCNLNLMVGSIPVSWSSAAIVPPTKWTCKLWLNPRTLCSSPLSSRYQRWFVHSVATSKEHDPLREDTVSQQVQSE